MGKFNSTAILNKIISVGDDLVGHTARKNFNTLNVLKEVHARSAGAIPQSTLDAAAASSKASAQSSLHTRIKTGVGATAAIGGGYYGLRKYQDYKDNKYLTEIDKLYNQK